MPSKGREKLYDTMQSYLQGSEEKLARQTENSSDPLVSRGLKVPLTTGDIAFLAEDLWKGHSAITGVPTRLVLIRWRRPQGKTMRRIGEGADEQKSSDVRLRDLVVMTKDEANRHEKLILKGGKEVDEVYDKETIAKIESRLAEAAEWEKDRF